MELLISYIAIQQYRYPVFLLCEENWAAPDLDSNPLHALGNHGSDKHLLRLWHSVGDNSWCW